MYKKSAQKSMRSFERSFLYIFLCIFWALKRGHALFIHIFMHILSASVKWDNTCARFVEAWNKRERDRNRDLSLWVKLIVNFEFWVLKICIKRARALLSAQNMYKNMYKNMHKNMHKNIHKNMHIFMHKNIWLFFCHKICIFLVRGKVKWAQKMSRSGLKKKKTLGRSGASATTCDLS